MPVYKIDALEKEYVTPKHKGIVGGVGHRT